MLARLARDTQAASLPGVYYAALGVRCGDALCVLHALTTADDRRGGPFHGGGNGCSCPGRPLRLLAVCGAWRLRPALIPALNDMPPMGLLGLIAVPACCLFFLAMALDSRPAAAGAYLTDSPPSGWFWPLSLTLGILYAFLKPALAGSVAILRGARLRPGRFGLCNGLLLGLTTGLANWALLDPGAGNGLY